MTLPAILFGLVIAILAAALFHILHGGDGWRLLLYGVLSVAGFALGQWVSIASGWGVYLFGMLDIGMGAVGSAVLLVLGDWLSRVEAKKS
jgi:hypothetical protein